MHKGIKNILSIALSGIFLMASSNAYAAGIPQQKESSDQSSKTAPVYEMKNGKLFSKDNLPLIVDVYADWCGPCKIYAPIFHEVAEKYEGKAHFISINADENIEMCRQYGITSIPCTLFINPDGQVAGKVTGLIEKEKLEKMVNDLF